MTRYFVFLLIVLLATPSLTIAATREQRLRDIQRQLSTLTMVYQQLLAAKKLTSATLGETSAKPKPKKVYSSPVILDGVTQLESLILQYTNDTRARHGLSPLSADAKLLALARAHSVDMLKNNYFAHKDLKGCNSICRMTNSGYPWEHMGENIHMMSGYQMSDSETARKIVNDWMNSPSHRANLLNPFFTHAGIGVAEQGLTLYTTAEYATPR